MISIAKVRDARYYLNQVAKGAEEYYLGAGEAPGQWMGAGAAGLGLAGRVGDAEFIALLEGRHPIHGSALLGTRTPRRRVPGFDLVVSAPKGVSLLAALGDDQTAAAVRACHDHAMSEALTYLERHASFVRRGKDGTKRLSGSAIASSSLAALLNDLRRPGNELGPKTVVVIDEAGMVGTRDLAALLGLVGRSKVVLVGDARQLPEVAAGGCFGALARGLGAIELSGNRRQRSAWERDALEELRSGQVGAAVSAYWAHGRISLAASPEGAKAAMVADWLEHRRSAPEASRLMVALRRRDVAELNSLAREALAQAGELGDEVMIGGRRWAVGEEVLGLRNDRRIGITNGTRGMILGFTEDNLSLRVRTGAGAELVLPGRYVEAGHLERGYALSLHKAQGATLERGFLLGSEALYREAGYTGLSRARQRSDLYAVAAGGREAPSSELGRLAARLERSGAQEMASERPGDRLDRLGAEADALTAALGAGRAGRGDLAGELAGIELAGIEEELAALAGTVGRGRGRAVLRAEALEARRAALVGAAGGEETEAAARAARLGRLAELEVAMAARVAQLGQAATLAPPEVVLDVLGPVPESLAARRHWRAGAEAVLGYRERWALVGPSALGVAEGSAAQRAGRRAAERSLAQAARALGRESVLDLGMEL